MCSEQALKKLIEAKTQSVLVGCTVIQKGQEALALQACSVVQDV